MTRREFSLALPVAGLAARWATASPLGGQNYPIRRRKKIEILFRSPEGNPNALEATRDGLWVGEQITDRAHLLDWSTGKSLVAHDTQSSNTSGMAVGAGFVFMAANGPAHLRPKRTHDVEKGGRIVKLDAKTGEHIKNYPTPNGGGLHGLLWAEESLWITQFRPNKILRATPNLTVSHEFDVPLNRAHGMGWDGEHLWCLFSNDFRILKFDVTTGRVVEAIQLDSTDPDPHGMTWWDGHLYYCDAGIAPGHQQNKSQYSGSICRIHV